MIVGAAVLGHVPTLMLPADVRTRLGGGRDTTLVDGMDRVRARLDECGADTLVIVDTHWFTTTEHIVDARPHHRGTYTSEELPKVLRGIEYDYPGAPELGRQVQDLGRARGMRVIACDDPNVAHHYPTLNLIRFLHRGEPVLTAGVCQTAEPDDFLQLGALIALAAAERGDRVAVLASGGMSHRFWPLSQILDHAAYDPEHVITSEARAMDESIIDHWKRGEHAAVVDLYPRYRSHSPEGLFGHYLTLLGAIGGRSCTAAGTQLSDYESSYGTGQVHVWFDLEGAA